MTRSAAPQTTALTTALIDAQVAFWLKQLEPATIAPLVAEELEHVFARLDQVTLNEAVAVEKVKTTARRYATEMEIGGAIPELFGQVASIIYAHPANQSTYARDLFNDDIVRELLDKVFERGSLLDQAVINLRQSEPFHAFLTDVAFVILKSYITDQNPLSRRVAPVRRGMARLGELLSTRAAGLMETVEGQTRHVLDDSISQILDLVHDLLSNDLYRESAQSSVEAFWDRIKHWPIERFHAYFTEMDLQELLVVGYEFWLDFRHTDYLNACIDAGIGFFFFKYGDDDLQSILDELGVTRDMIRAEVQNYAPDLAALLHQQGLTEQFLRRHLTRFYESADAQALLTQVQAPPQHQPDPTADSSS